MKKAITLILLFLVFPSCQSIQEKDAFERERKKQLSLQKEAELKQAYQDKANKRKLEDKTTQEKENEFYDKLNSNILLEQSEENNKRIAELLGEKSKGEINKGSPDLESDSSITKFVNNTISFTNVNYIPQDLLKIQGEFIEDTKGNSQLRKEALDNLLNLSENFYLRFGEQMKVISAYRSYEYQKGIKDRGCPDNLCAKAGFSEHQSGLAVDFWEASTQAEFMKKENLAEYFDWMNKTAHHYGFTNTYTKGLDIDGYEIEPWHWRYVGIELAKFLHENDLSFAEYYREFSL